MSALLEQRFLNFRKMTAYDLEEVFEIERAAYEVPWSKVVLRKCIDVGDDCWLLYADDELLGYSIASCSIGEAHLLNICVAPSHQGQGYGRELLHFAMRRMAILGARRVFLEVGIHNYSAQALYKSENFEQIGIRKNYYLTRNGREDALVMARAI